MSKVSIQYCTTSIRYLRTPSQLKFSPEEVLALLNYMLDHNRHHADELHVICHALEDEGKAEAAAALAEALHAFDHGNDKLEKALELAKQA